MDKTRAPGIKEGEVGAWAVTRRGQMGEQPELAARFGAGVLGGTSLGAGGY